MSPLPRQGWLFLIEFLKCELGRFSLRQSYIKELCKRGVAVTSTTVIATAQGIIMNKDTNLLSCNGGGINLNTDWAKLLLTHMGFVKRKACSKVKADVSQFQQLKDEFLLEIKNIVSMDEIPTVLVINFDQTALSYIPTSHLIMEQEGTMCVEIIAKGNKRQITAVLQVNHPETFTTTTDI